MPAKLNKTGRREAVQITAGCWIFLLFSFDRRRLLARDGRVSTARDGGGSWVL